MRPARRAAVEGLGRMAGGGAAQKQLASAGEDARVCIWDLDLVRVQRGATQHNMLQHAATQHNTLRNAA